MGGSYSRPGRIQLCQKFIMLRKVSLSLISLCAQVNTEPRNLSAPEQELLQQSALGCVVGQCGDLAVCPQPHRDQHVAAQDEHKRKSTRES